MSDKATTRQKQFLRQLGHTSFDGLTKDRASSLIEQLLQAEKASGKTFPCPYCKKPFGPRPSRTKKCPACQKTIIHLSGKFYTEDQANELNQKEWLADSRREARENIKDDWKQERAFRKEFGEPHFVGYIIRVGTGCKASLQFNGLLVAIEDACKTPEMLPPFDSCHHETCECEYDLVSQSEVPKGTLIAELDGDKQNTKTNPISHSTPKTRQKTKGSGCAGVFLLAFLCVCGVVTVAREFPNRGNSRTPNWVIAQPMAQTISPPGGYTAPRAPTHERRRTNFPIRPIAGFWADGLYKPGRTRPIVPRPPLAPNDFGRTQPQLSLGTRLLATKIASSQGSSHPDQIPPSTLIEGRPQVDQIPGIAGDDGRGQGNWQGNRLSQHGFPRGF
jgi:hypothetical protein